MAEHLRPLDFVSFIMPLVLTIENVDSLPDGGPVSIFVDEKGLEIGRHGSQGWVLPDPRRIVSRRHCEIRFEEGGYWLHDVSTHGTFVNGSEFRLPTPHRLRDGDRFAVGPYIISAHTEGEAPPELKTGTVAPSTFGGNVWGQWAQQAPRPTGQEPLGTSIALPETDFADTIGELPEPRPALASGKAGAFAWAAEPPRGVEKGPPVETPASAPVLAQDAQRVATTSPPRALGFDVLARIAEGAGLPAATFEGRDPQDVAAEIGEMLRLTAERLAAQLRARDETRALMRATNRSPRGVQAFNPLEFPGDPLAILLGPRNPRYLAAREAVEKGFSDLELHQVLTFAAMRGALEQLFAELAPDSIEGSLANDRGLGALLTSRKAQLWDIYNERWRALSRRSDGRLFEAFWALIGEAYDRLSLKDG